MKKLFLFLSVITAWAVQAQGITEQNLQGSWKMCAFDINGIYWDFKTDDIRLPKEYEGSLGENQKAALIADIREGMSAYKEGTFMIKGNYIEQVMGSDVASGTYTIEKKDGLDYMKVVNDDGAKTIDMLQVAIREGRLHVTIPDEIGGTSTLIYCR